MCVICNERQCDGTAFCRVCGDNYDRTTARDDGTLLAAMIWAAKRARYFERKRKPRAGGKRR